MPVEGSMPHSIAPAASDSVRIPTPGDRPGMHLPVSVHGHEEIRVDPEDVARQRLAARPHAADGTRFEHAAAARRDGPAVQRFGRCPADRPTLERLLNSSAYATVDAVSGQARPRKKPPPSASAGTGTWIHVVKRDETLSGIFDVSGWQRVAQLNNLRNPNLIYPGTAAALLAAVQLRPSAPCRRPHLPYPNT